MAVASTASRRGLPSRRRSSRPGVAPRGGFRAKPEDCAGGPGRVPVLRGNHPATRGRGGPGRHRGVRPRARVGQARTPEVLEVGGKDDVRFAAIAAATTWRSSESGRRIAGTSSSKPETRASRTWASMSWRVRSRRVAECPAGDAAARGSTHRGRRPTTSRGRSPIPRVRAGDRAAAPGTGRRRRETRR